jgi:hypothetical protein
MPLRRLATCRLGGMGMRALTIVASLVVATPVLAQQVFNLPAGAAIPPGVKPNDVVIIGGVVQATAMLAPTLPANYQDAVPKSFDDPQRDIPRQPRRAGGVSFAIQGAGIALPPGVQEQQACGGDSPRDTGRGGCVGAAASASTTEDRPGTSSTANRIALGSESVFAGTPDIRIEDAGIETPKGFRVD